MSDWLLTRYHRHLSTIFIFTGLFDRKRVRVWKKKKMRKSTQRHILHDIYNMILIIVPVFWHLPCRLHITHSMWIWITVDFNEWGSKRGHDFPFSSAGSVLWWLCRMWRPTWRGREVRLRWVLSNLLIHLSLCLLSRCWIISKNRN